jgi:hypothetical protein
MTQSSTSRFVFLGIRVACVLGFLAFVIRDFQLQGWRSVFHDVGLAVIVMCITFANRQGSKLAADNIRKAGLNPDRDETHCA